MSDTNEFLIELQAKLDEEKSKGNINADIESLQSKLNELKLQTIIDQSTLTKLEKQLQNIINQKLTIANIEIDNNKIDNNLKQTSKNIEKHLQSSVNSVIQKSNFEKIFKVKDDRNNTAKNAKDFFGESFKNVSIKENFDKNNNLDSFTVTIKNAEGAINHLKYTYEEAINAFKYSGGSANDSGVLKLADNILSKTDSLQLRLDKLKADYLNQNASKPIKEPENISKLSVQYDNVAKAIANIKNSDNDTFSSMVSNAQREISVLDTMISQFRDAEHIAIQLKSTDISTGIAQAQERLGKLKANSTGFEQMNKTIKDLDIAIANVGDKSSLNSFIDSLKVAESQLGRVKAEARTMASSLQIDRSILNLNDQLRKNSRYSKEAKEQIAAWIAELKNGDVARARLNEINLQARQLHSNMESLNRTGQGFFEGISSKINSLTTYLSAAMVISKSFSAAKSGIASIRELDTSLVDLKKTTKMDADELEEFYYTSNDVAKQMGVTTKAIIDQASAWSRLGYSTAEQATTMAKLSSQFALISPGMSIDDATTGLVSVMKAYDMDVNDVLDGIESKINIIGNNLAISNADIITMLQDSVSAMAEGRNTLEETIALESAAFEIAQDTSVGNGFKTVALRLRGMNEETMELDDSLKTIKGDLYELTGVSIMEDANTYKSTYQILKEISQVWDSLTDKSRADALELMFGKHRANIGSAVIKNFNTAEKAMILMANSAGDADKEMSVAMDSIDYKLNTLSETGTKVAQNLFQRDDIKTVIDVLNSLAGVVEFVTDKLGLFGTASLASGLAMSKMGIGECIIF